MRYLTVLFIAGLCWGVNAAGADFPPALDSYQVIPGESIWESLASRAKQVPFNVIGSLIFLLAIIHTFLAPMFQRLAHHLEEKHRERLARLGPPEGVPEGRNVVSFRAEALHFFGEVEAIFGLWVVPLMVLWTVFKGWPSARAYLETRGFAEPVFVVVIMAMSASRPIMRLAEMFLASVARLGGGSVAAWWMTILTLGPLMGSFITEPAAMTISALLLCRKFFDHGPSRPLAYATIGLLFVNVSVGGTLTHFAAPPVLMISGKWHWDTLFMLEHFGWKAAVAVLGASMVYLVWFRSEFKQLNHAGSAAQVKPVGIPWWVTATSVGFLWWTVVNSHYPVLTIAGFLFYLAFAQSTEHHHDELSLKTPLLVGFFLAGLVVHGGLQGWWIDPVLRGLGRVPLFCGATFLTAFNDNAAITYLAAQVPDFGDKMKYAVVAGAVTGGGLTVIANAPNPAGQSILSRYFSDGVSPFGLFVGALIPTIIVAVCFLVF